MTHNISINITEVDSPAVVRRRVHLRSLSDVTPAARAHVVRARSHSDRTSPRPAPRSPPRSPRSPPRRAVRSERSSPNLSAAAPRSPRPRAALSVLGDPWRKMSDADPKSDKRDRLSFDGTSRSDDPWIKNSSSHRTGEPSQRSGKNFVKTDVKRDSASFKRGKLERKSAVACEASGRESSESWPVCTCPMPRAPPDRDDAALYKSVSQKNIFSIDKSESAKRAPDPLLETTC